jgi:hypothetical protein
MPLARLRANGLLAGGSGCLEQGVETRSGHGVPSEAKDERRSRDERSFASLGQNERPCEKHAETGTAKQFYSGTVPLLIFAFLGTGP